METSYQNYATLPSAIISDGALLTIPLWAISTMVLSETYSLPPIANTTQRAVLPVHNDTVTITAQLVGLERHAWKAALELLAESSKRGTALEAYSQGKVGGLVLVTSLTIRTDMQISSLSFTVNSTKRSCIDVSMTLQHVPRPGYLDKILDLATIGVAMLADIGEYV
jgi:hypothetical protein